MSCFFPDTVVLCHFAAIGRLDLLQGWLAGRGRWTQAVFAEVRRSEKHHPTLRAVLQPGHAWMGRSLRVYDTDAVEELRAGVFGGSSQRPSDHLGEAKTCHLVISDPSFQGSTWVTDDRSAYAYGIGRGLDTADTFDVMSDLVADGMPPADGFAHLQAMVTAGRHLLRTPSQPGDLL